jgi:hypothetical protein
MGLVTMRAPLLIDTFPRFLLRTLNRVETHVLSCADTVHYILTRICYFPNSVVS